MDRELEEFIKQRKDATLNLPVDRSHKRIYIFFLFLILFSFLAYIFLNHRPEEAKVVSKTSSTIKTTSSGVAGRLFDEVIFSRNSHYALLAETNCSECKHFSTGIGILDTSTNSYKTLTSRNGLVGSYWAVGASYNHNLFSPYGEFVVYPVASGDFPSYYELYVYDTTKKSSRLLTKTNKDLMYVLNGADKDVFPGTNGVLYGWANDYTVIYTCGGRAVTGATSVNSAGYYQNVCLFHTDTDSVELIGTQQINQYSGKKELVYVPTSLKTVPSEGNSTLSAGNSSVYNTKRDMFFDVVTAGVFQKIVLHEKDKVKEIFSGKYDQFGRAPYSEIYWSSDNHIYGKSPGNVLVKLK